MECAETVGKISQIKTKKWSRNLIMQDQILKLNSLVVIKMKMHITVIIKPCPGHPKVTTKLTTVK